jgi:transposase
MYIAYICTGIEWKSSVHLLPNLISKHHIMGKPEARAQAVGMLQAGSTQAEVAEAMKISLSTVKRWWKKWVSQKSLVDEKRSERLSVLRKVAKIVISKSFHKRGWSTRKLAS